VLVVAGQDRGVLEAGIASGEQARADARADAAVHFVAHHHLGARLLRFVGGTVVRAVVDHDHRRRPATRDLAHDVADLAALVVCGDYDTDRARIDLLRARHLGSDRRSAHAPGLSR
jgi:hypothetical protein